MVGSGRAGMDPTGAASMLGRMNAALSAGGAKGEASQFFTSMVANRMGLDPLQMQVLREGGMFATKDQMFGFDRNGKASPYMAYMGQTGPTGSSTFYDETRKLIEEKYAGNSESQKLLRANAFANHTGLNMNQAMAALSLKPNEMGELQKYAGDMKGMNASGLLNLSKAVTGTDDDRKALADQFRGRSDVSQKDKEELEKAMKGSAEDQKSVLAKLSAQYEQERTQGQEIRDSRAALDNIKTKMADYAVPALLDIRKGILHLAGKGDKTPAQVMEDIARAESKDAISGIHSGYESTRKKLRDERTGLLDEERGLRGKRAMGQISEEEYNKRRGEIQERLKGIDGEMDAAKTDRDSRIKTEEQALPGRINAARQSATTAAAAGTPNGAGSSVPMASSMSDIADPEKRKNLKIFSDVVAMSEGANYNTLVGQGKFNKAITDLGQHPNKVGLVTADGPSTAAGRYQFVNRTWRGLAAKLGLTDFSPESQDKAFIETLRQRGVLDMVLNGDFEGAARKPGMGNEWQSLPTGSSPNQGKHSWDAFRKMVETAKKNYTGTPLPEVPNGQNWGRGSAVSFDPLRVDIVHKDSSGREVAPRQELQTRVTAPQPDVSDRR